MRVRSIALTFLGGAIGALVTIAAIQWSLRDRLSPQLATIGREVAALHGDVDRLKKVVPDQAHAMQDVDYHFSNLWFAGRAGNWPLADFYWKETISHLRWAMRIIPVRKDNAGRDVDVQSILEGFENSSLMEVGDAIEAKDHGRFETTYKRFLEACHACHTSADKPYLRPQLPEGPVTGIIDFDPAAQVPR